MKTNSNTNEMAEKTVGVNQPERKRHHAALRRCMQFMLIRYKKKAKIKNRHL
jgi:uncharacterized protein YaeQ